MPIYEDKRHRFKNVNPADFLPGTPRFDNPTKLTYKKESVVSSSVRPRDTFRIYSLPKQPEPEPILEPTKTTEIVPSPDTWEL